MGPQETHRSERRGRRPNIVLIHWHDLGTRLGCYGHRDVTNPQLDALANEGLLFTRAFSTAPLCSPARGSLFTGLYPEHHGLVGLAHLGSAYRPGTTTLPRVLAEAGYSSALVGLQHESSDPGTLGFDEVIQPEGRPFCGPVTDLAVDWLRQERTSPWFLTVGFFEVHRPYRTEWYGEPGPLDAVEVPAYLPDNEHTRLDLAMMGRSIERADADTGRILDAIAARADADDTLVIFTTDHGAAFPRAKSTLYDPGIHVSLIVRPPSSWHVAPGSVGDLTSHVDLVATLADVVGVTTESDGLSFADALQGRPSAPRDEVYAAKDFHEVYDPVRCVRTKDYKYVRNLVEGPLLTLPGDIEESPTRIGLGNEHLAPRPAEELYHLADDPDERTDLARDPRHRAALEELRSQLDDWLDAQAQAISDLPAAPRPRPSPRTLAR